MEKFIELAFDMLVLGSKSSELDGLFRGRKKRRRSLVSGTKEISFNLDKKGMFDVEAEPFGAGISVNYEIVVDDPQANYEITIYSSGGGGGVYKNIKAGQKINGVIKTNKGSKTKLKISIKSDKKDAVGHATIRYSV